MKNATLIISIFFLLFTTVSFSQNVDTSEINKLILLSEKNLPDSTNLSFKYANEAIELSKKNADKSFVIKCYNNIANLYTANYNYDSALYFYKKIIEIGQSDKDSISLGNTYYLMAKVFYKQDKYAKSMKYNFEALGILEKTDEKGFVSDIYLDLGRIYYFSNNPDKSLEYYEKSLKNASEISDSLRIAKIYSWLGYAYGQKNLDSLSLEYHKKALVVAKGTENKASIAIYTSSVGDSYIKLEEYNIALEYIINANKLFEEISHYEGFSWTLMSSSNCYRELGSFIKAAENGQKAFEISTSMKFNNIAKLSSESLYKTYKELNNYTLSIFYLENYLAYSDTLLNEGKLTEMAEIQTKHEIEKQELENLMLKAELEIQNKEVEIHKVRSRFLFFLIFVLIIITVGIFYIFRYKNKSLKQKNEIYEKQKLIEEKHAEVEKAKRELIEVELKNTKLESEKLKGELDYKNKELMNFALHITEKNEFLEKVKSDIKDIKDKFQGEKVKDLYLSINQTLQIDSDREKFQMHVEEVHHSFFHKLDAKYPDLTKGEKKLLALLMMNLSSKEIASTMNISPASVNTKRYRLRKKLEMGTDESLIEFLKKL
jgi:tetratricopeptide (TPR) repeat protein